MIKKSFMEDEAYKMVCEEWGRVRQVKRTPAEGWPKLWIPRRVRQTQVTQRGSVKQKSIWRWGKVTREKVRKQEWCQKSWNHVKNLNFILGAVRGQRRLLSTWEVSPELHFRKKLRDWVRGRGRQDESQWEGLCPILRLYIFIIALSLVAHNLNILISFG